MPDRYDPKLSLRPAGDRKAADLRRAQTGDDPLAELAKIVSGRPSSSAAARSRPSPSSDPAASPSGGDVLGDLETELLNDLQASFAAVRELTAAPTPAPPAPRPRADPVPPPPPPLRPAPAHAIRNEPPAERPPTDLAEMFAPMPYAPDAGAEPAPLPSARAEPPLPRLVPTSASQAPSEEPPDRPARASHAGAGGKPDLGAFQLRSTAAAMPPPASPPRPPHSRWETPEPAKPAHAGASRFAPPRAAPPPTRPPAPDDDDLDPFAEGGLFAEPEESEEIEEFPLDGFGESEGDEASELPYPEGDLASLVEPRRSRGLILVASIVGVVVIGGIAVAMFRPADTGPGTPPIIVADGLPTKITPDDTSVADAEAQNKLIYDRVNSGAQDSETTLLTPGDEPIAAVPPDAAADNPITRVIIPGGPGIDAAVTDEGLSLDGQRSAMAPAADGSMEIAAGGADDPMTAIGPRRVRTVVVKPDGTIVDSTASEAGNAAPGGLTTGAAAPPAIELPTPPPVVDDTAAIAGGQPNAELAITPVPEAGIAEIAAAPPPEMPAPAAVPEPPPVAEAAPPPPTAVAAVDQAAPMDLTQTTPPAGQAPAGAVSGMLVQVSSQRSEDAARATYRDLQERYPNILGNFEPNIQRAEIADRGTFFRVRVGPFSAGDAERLCNDLKSAGGDCILAQR